MKIYIVLVLMIIILLVLIYHKKKDIENFTSKDDKDYLATQCMENGKPNPYANCKCADKFGTCKVCYPTEKKYESGSNVVYDATNSFS
jgi:predicted Holliday junction resolvase-like endonuclease